MMTLRCTQKLLKRMGVSPRDVAEAPSSTNALGDWYANLLYTRPEQLVMCVSEKSRLCVLVTAKNPDRLVQRIEIGIADVLRDIGVPPAHIQHETRLMSPLTYGSTTGAAASRSVIGTMTEYLKPLEYHLIEQEYTLDEISVRLSQDICGPLNWARPVDVAKKLLAESYASATPDEIPIS